MDKKLHGILYQELLGNDVININYSDYFEKYILEINRTKGSGKYKIHNGKAELDNFSYTNFVLFLYIMDVDLNDERLRLLENLCDWQKWLINLENFDYSQFKSEWILLFHHLNTPAFEKFGKIDAIKEAVKRDLKKNYNRQLAEIYVKYLI
jgi:hypothetical protein